MQVISQELSAQVSAVSIIHAKEGALGPCLMLPVLRFDYIQNYGDAVLIISPDEALIGIRGVCPNDPVPAETALSGLVIGHDYPGPRLQRELPRVILLAPLYRRVLVEHLVDVDGGETLNLGVHTRGWVEFLAHINVLLVLLEEVLQIQLAIRSRTHYRRLLVIQDILRLALLRVMLVEGGVRIS